MDPLDISPFFRSEKSVFFEPPLFKNPPMPGEPNFFAPVDPFNKLLFEANILALPEPNDLVPPLRGIPPFNPSFEEANFTPLLTPPLSPPVSSIGGGAGMNALPGLTTSVPPWSVIDIMVVLPSGNSNSSSTSVSVAGEDSVPLSVSLNDSLLHLSILLAEAFSTVVATGGSEDNSGIDSNDVSSSSSSSSSDDSSELSSAFALLACPNLNPFIFSTVTPLFIGL